MLEEAIRKYQNRSIEMASIIAELIELAKQMREAQGRGEKLGLSEDEIAFYDALEVNDSAVKVLGDETLKTIAAELVEAVRRSVTIDWGEGKRAGADSAYREEDTEEIRIPTRQTGQGNGDGAGAGGAAVRGVGGVVRDSARP